MPCGRCRQLLWENGGAGPAAEDRERDPAAAEVLPDAFGPDDLHP
jgi:cytidine deaminase